MATTLPGLPPPPSNAGSAWKQAYKVYQADPQAGYAAYYNFLAKGTSSKQLLAQGNYPAPAGSGGSTNSTGQTQPPPAVPITNAGIPGLPGPTPAPVPIMSQGYSGPNSRFGSYNMAPYVIGQGYAPPLGTPGGVPAPAPSPTPNPSPSPAPPPSPGGSGGPAGAPGGVPQGGGQGGGAGGYGGNAGGAQQADRGMGGGYGGGGNGGFGGGQQAAPGSPGSASAQTGVPGSIDIGSWGNHLLSAAATAAPFPYGAGVGALQAGMRGYNTYQTDALRQQQGLPGLDFGQAVGGVLGLNNYGDLGGGQTVANPEQFTPFINDRIQQAYAPNGTTLFGPASTYAPNSMAETSYGQDYQSGPGGILGFISRALGLSGNPTSAWSAGNTSAFLGGPGSMGSTATGDLGARGIPASSGAPSATSVAAPGGVPSSGAAGSQGYHLTNSGQIRDVATGQIVSKPTADQTQAAYSNALTTGNNANQVPGGYAGTASQQSNGAPADSRQSAFSSNGTYSNPGGGTTANGGAGTGGLNNGFGGGGYAKGGYVLNTDSQGAHPRFGHPGGDDSGMQRFLSDPPDVASKSGNRKIQIPGGPWNVEYEGSSGPAPRPRVPGWDPLNSFAVGGQIPGRRDNVKDNRPIMADEGEFVIRRSAAQHLGPQLLRALNDPQVAMHLANFLHSHFGGRS